ncbi:MAG TPA: cytochrome c [Casimicrobiaceae bacterium]|nr:cytochrome c [Casimicrobiaceae bacterium]
MRTMISGATAFALSLAMHTVATAQATTPQAGASTAQASTAQPSGNKVTRTENGKTLYTVVDGYKVDSNTMNGFRAWRAAACDRCHGANQQGLVGPSLIESLKTLTKAEFVKTLHDGRLEKGMPSWQTSKMVMDNMDNLYAYLKGRSNGDITRAHVEELKQ